MKRMITLIFCCLFCAAAHGESSDLTLADFNGSDYGNWTVEGTAFGTQPASGTLPGQMPVTGFVGAGLVNSFNGGDEATGKLVSPDFTIDRQFVDFLIGGGGFEETVYMALYVDGKVVQRATGPNTVGGGTERLEAKHWDVSEFVGKRARIEIVDNASGGWGHINVDEIVLSDTARGEPVRFVAFVEKSRELKTDKRFLLIPVAATGPKTFLRVEADGKKIRDISLRLAEKAEDVQFYGSLEISPWKNVAIKLVAERVTEDSIGLELVKESDDVADLLTAYREKYRPQFHFAPRRGWTNDPNGLVWYKGTYHLFYQHNPYSVEWGNMTWGHATSPDLLHWTEGNDAFCPDELGTIFSGSGVVDANNTSGLAPAGNAEAPLVFFFTSHGPEARPAVSITQSLGYSLDGGKSFQKYAKNPVVPHIIGGNRDPKVFWYEPTQLWVMALYLDGEDYALLGSKNLTEWNELCRIEKLGCSECPDMFELAVDGDPDNMKWVFWGGNGNYLIGSFDGSTFTKEAGPFLSKHGGNDYAAQTFSNLPDGRRIQFSWMNGGVYPEMPFNQQFSIPRELSLKTTKEGIRLAFSPIAEIKSLRSESVADFSNYTIESKQMSFGIPELFDAEMTLDVRNAKNVKIKFNGQELVYDVAAEKINGMIPLAADNEGKVTIRLIVDRMSWELFAADGVTQFAQCFVPNDESLDAGQMRDGEFSISIAEGETVGIESLRVWPLESVWNDSSSTGASDLF